MPANNPDFLPNFASACPKCSAQMKIVRVTLAEEELEDCTFECPKCHYGHTRVFKAT
jgi:hypothetical protein